MTARLIYQEVSHNIINVLFFNQLYDSGLQIILTFTNKYVTNNDLILLAGRSIQHNLY
jgi:hypothetical protein